MADDSFAKNQQWVLPGEHQYNTDLGDKEPAFQAWVKENKVPFDPAEQTPDYDMRGFWKASQEGDPRAQTAPNPNDGLVHYNDYWKTPYHPSFSNESQWADPAKAPKWNEQDQLVTPDGKVVFDEKALAIERQMKKQQQNLLLAKALTALVQRVKQHAPQVSQ